MTGCLKVLRKKKVLVIIVLWAIFAIILLACAAIVLPLRRGNITINPGVLSTPKLTIITPTSIPTLTEEEIRSGWQIYQNDKYGLFVKYLENENYNIEVREREIDKITPSEGQDFDLRISFIIKPTKPRPLDFADAGINITLYANTKNYTLEQYIASEIEKNKELTASDFQKITRWGKKVYKYSPEYGELYQLLHGTNIVDIDIYYNNPIAIQEFEPLVSQILNNLDFLEKSSERN